MKVVFVLALVLVIQHVQSDLDATQQEKLLEFGIAARESGEIYIAGESYFLHTIIQWKPWSDLMKNTIIKLEEIQTKLSAQFNPAVETSTNLLKSINEEIQRIRYLQSYYIRQIQAAHADTHPAWRNLLRYRTTKTVTTVGAVPTLAPNSNDIWLQIDDCADYLAPITPTIDIDVAGWSTVIGSWETPIKAYITQVKEAVKNLDQFIIVFNDIKRGRFPLICLQKARWKEVLVAMGITIDTNDAILEELLQNIANLPTTDVNIEKDGNLQLTTILPLLSSNSKLSFKLYYVGTTPIPTVGFKWMEYKTQTWMALNKDNSWIMEFDNLEQLNEGCISNNNVWWCFESFPVRAMSDRDCWALLLQPTPAPTKGCFTTPTKNQYLDIIDVATNTYLISNGKERDMAVSCPKPGASGHTTTVTKIAAGITKYNMPHKCAAAIEYFYLPANWYLPTTDPADNKLLNDLSKYHDAKAQEQSDELLNWAAKIDKLAKQATEAEKLIPLAEPAPPVPRTEKPSPPPSVAPLVSHNDVNKPTESTPANVAGSTPGVDPKNQGFTKEAARDFFRKLVLDIEGTFELGDIIALSASFAALFISTILIIRDMYKNCCKTDNGPLSNRLDTQDCNPRVGSWFARPQRRQTTPLPAVPLIQVVPATASNTNTASPTERSSKHRNISSKFRARSNRTSHNQRQTTSFRVGAHHVQIHD